MPTTRRTFLLGAASLLAAPPVFAAQQYDGDFEIPEALWARRVRVQDSIPAGLIYVLTNQFRLIFTLGDGAADAYPIGVGEAGAAFGGEAYVGRKAEWPSWTPTANMIAREPELYGPYAGGVPGGPDNPLGARALYLYRDGRDTMYRIHGNSQPWAVGLTASTGCIRMFNSHITRLYEMVPTGTRVFAQ